MTDHNHSHYALNPLPGDNSVASSKPSARDTGTLTTLPPQPAQGYEFCRFCGQSIVADAVVCVHCGRQIKDLQTPNVAVVTKEPKRISWHIGEMIGLMLMTMLCPLVGYIYGHIRCSVK